MMVISTICQHWQQNCNTFIFSHSLKFLGWWILCPTHQQSSGMNCLTCTSHLAQEKIEILTQPNPMLHKFTEFTEARNSWAKNSHHYNVLLICASPIPGLEFLSESVLWHFLSSQFNYCLCDCASGLFERVKILCFTMLLCYGTFQRLPWKIST